MSDDDNEVKVSPGSLSGHGSEDVKYEHPSFGMALFSRVTHGGKTRLFGSSIDSHHTTIRLQVTRGERHHHLSRDWYFGDGRPMIEVEFSAAQFAELITCMNINSGVPCTIRAFDGKQVKEPPSPPPLEADEVREGFQKQTAAVAKRVTEGRKKIAELFESRKGLPKAVTEQVLHHLDMVEQDIRANMPFVLKQFEEAAGKVVTAAKAEIDATVSATVTREGLKAMLERAGEGPTVTLLEAGTRSEDEVK